MKHTEKLMEENLQKQVDQQANDEHTQDVFALMDSDPFNENPLQYYLNKKRGK